MKELGKYEILKEVGRGGFAVVYKARDTTLDRVVALKVLRPHVAEDNTFVRRFKQEARTAAGLYHPHIVTIYEVSEEAGQHYLAMAFLPGHTLDERLAAAEGPLPLEKTVSILEQVASALDAIHQRGLVHRDVKPTNVIVDDTGQATILDFGIARAADGTQLTTTGAVMGTPQYMSPEQAEGEGIDHRSDVYALGVVAYQMCTGQAPFDAVSPLVVLRLHADKSPPPPRELNPHLPVEVERVLLKALAKEREERYQSAGELARALREAMEAAERSMRREEQLGERYEQLKAVVATQDWGEVVALGEQIQALDPNYRDVADLVEQGRKHLRRPKHPTVPAWAWGAGVAGLFLVILVVLGMAVVPRLLETISTTPETTPEFPIEAPTEPFALSEGGTWIRPADGMVMVYVQAGEFQMGSDDSDVNYALHLCNEERDDCDREWFEYEQPVHTVALGSFWIDQTEVTNAQYRRCVEAGGCEPPSSRTSSTRDEYYGNSGYDDYPVIWVSWYQARAYCEWAGARLPTEAEWEYTARGPDSLVYPWGDNPPSDTLANCHLYVGDTTRVGSYYDGASWCGALDMAGNVWEWVADWYGDYLSGRQVSPTGLSLGEFRVLRGGSWSGSQRNARCAYRNRGHPGAWNDHVGFRCARGSE
jgi:formylglycine-generating enzyme required for sulfatase activity/tRNA A-37 threonylcarbamoyl transferase component Bud32